MSQGEQVTPWLHAHALSILPCCLRPPRIWSRKPRAWLVPEFCLLWLERPIVTFGFGLRIILFLWCSLGTPLGLFISTTSSLGGLQRAPAAGFPEAKSSPRGLKRPSELHRGGGRGEKANIRCRHFPPLHLHAPHSYQRTSQKALRSISLELKVKCGIAPLGPRGRGRERDIEAI